ncbi:hypothetical protein CUPS4244_02700 [Campylobacter upsaliensis]|uniref:hypothetical protein n=1 Tax=Campylobacter upsaliensis TaxID=28080 RepID=UPI002149DC22|nr:hypothetical protein [Campylobacter upsaliensis]MCR2104006.1 hypothetical protein [Campylobacter upsaliensis]
MKKTQRNVAVLASYKREISLNTRVGKDKSKYSRKEKHKAFIQKAKEEQKMIAQANLSNELEDLEIARIIKERVLDKKELNFVSEEEMEKYFNQKGVFV